MSKQAPGRRLSIFKKQGSIFLSIVFESVKVSSDSESVSSPSPAKSPLESFENFIRDKVRFVIAAAFCTVDGFIPASLEEEPFVILKKEIAHRPDASGYQNYTVQLF